MNKIKKTVARLREFFKEDFSIYQSSFWLHTFAQSMITIFIPIFLIEIGYPISQVILYFFLFNLIDVPLNFVARFFVRKLGARKVIILGSFFSVIFFVCLYSLTPNNWPLLILTALFAALYDTFYWVAHIYLVMRCSKHDDNVSGDVSMLSIVQSIAGLLAPSLGAVIAIWGGKNYLIAASALVLIVSIYPLFKIKNILDKPRREQLPFRKFFDKWDFAKDYIRAVFFNFHGTTEWVIWPIFIFLFFNNMKSVAALSIVSSVTSIIFNYFVGRIKKEKREIFMASGAILIALIWLARLFFGGPVIYYVSVFLVGIFSISVSIPLESNIYEKGEKKEVLSTSMYRNAANMFGNAVLFGVLFLTIKLANFFNLSLEIAIVGLLTVVWISYSSFGGWRKIIGKK